MRPVPTIALLSVLLFVLPTGIVSQQTEIPSEILNAEPINVADRLSIVSNFLQLLRNVNPNLPLQEFVYGIDPIQQLRNLQFDLNQLPANDTDDAYAFHLQILRISDSMRDNHMIYLLPPPFADYIAALPFALAEYYETVDNEIVRKYLFSRVAEDRLSNDSMIRVGLEIIAWNGVPIDQAIAELGERSRGANEGAMLAEGLFIATIRPLIAFNPPENPFVVVTMVDDEGNIHREPVLWAYFPRETEDPTNTPSPTAEPTSPPLFGGSEACTQTVEELFGSAPLELGQMAMRDSRVDPAKTSAYLSLGVVSPIREDDGIAYGTVETKSGTFGYIRISSFLPQRIDIFWNIFAEAIATVPKDGLLIDVRRNGGGFVVLSDILLQYLTPREIMPSLFQPVVSPVLQRMAASENGTFELAEWKKSIDVGVEWGAQFAAMVPITPPALANCFEGERYSGPVVALMDGETYSATDAFLANFQDAEIGTIVGTDTQSGAGGANNVRYSDFVTDFSDIFDPLPEGVEIGFPFRRFLRTDAHVGIPVEHFGVEPDVLYRPTRRDRIESDADLFNTIGEILASQNLE